MNYEVIFYEDGRGRSPVKDFLDVLDAKACKSKSAKTLLAKFALYVSILEQKGTRCGTPYTKYIGNGIWELRPKNHRVFFFCWDNNKIVLLHTFRKSTQKTPQTEIARAIREMQDWLANGAQRI